MNRARVLLTMPVTEIEGFLKELPTESFEVPHISEMRAPELKASACDRCEVHMPFGCLYHHPRGSRAIKTSSKLGVARQKRRVGSTLGRVKRDFECFWAENHRFPSLPDRFQCTLEVIERLNPAVETHHIVARVACVGDSLTACGYPKFLQAQHSRRHRDIFS